MTTFNITESGDNAIKVSLSVDQVLSRDSVLAIQIRDRIKMNFGTSAQSKRIVIAVGDTFAIANFSATPKETQKHINIALQEVCDILTGSVPPLMRGLAERLAS